MRIVRLLVALALVLPAGTGTARAAQEPALIPEPVSIAHCAAPRSLDRPLVFPRTIDAGGFELLRSRWSALGIAPPRIGARADVHVRVGGPPGDAYTLHAGADVTMTAAGSAGMFNALATLAQLPVRRGAGWELPCVAIGDRPALRWRIVSDDISRGPFPTLRYFQERIRTLASFKINGWSPYMEQVFADPAHPYVAFPNALDGAELRALRQYAARFHVALIPEQQTFAHMHEALKYETLAPLAELPHGYLLAPDDPGTPGYLAPLLRAELAAAGPVPFFAVGADEPIDLGRGRTPRTAAVYAAHVSRVGALVGAAGARPIIWDDAIQQDPAILELIDHRTVIATFHYGAEPSFAKYIATVAGAGFEQFVSPGAANWNEIFPDLTTAYANAAQFLADGRAAHVLGMFETVWHDDGESLYEATWAPVVFAAAGAWQAHPVDRATWNARFARVFFGSDDARYGADLDALAAVRDLLRTPPASDPPDYWFWADPFDARIQARAQRLDLATLRRRAEAVLTHLETERPPLGAAAAGAMRLGALRYDTLARRLQIGAEARSYYDEARAHAATHDDGVVYRDLNVAKYLCWELRDEMTDLAPVYARAWRYESTEPGLQRVLVRYRAAAQAAMAAADALNAAQREDYLRTGSLPAFDAALGRAP